MTSKKVTPKEFAAIAHQVAKKYADEMVRQYAASVEKNLEDYDSAPDQDDFFSWLEGYEWPAPKEKG